MKTICKLCSWTNKISPEKAGILGIVISIFFAAIMLGMSYFLRDTAYAEKREVFMYLLIALWWIPFFALSRRSGNSCKTK